MSAAVVLMAAAGGNAAPDTDAWTDVCELDDVPPYAAVCVLVRGRQVAIFRPGETDDLFALDNFDPFSKAHVLSRGIIGDRGGVLKIASPIYKQSFNLRTGVCLDDATVRIDVFAVRVNAGRVEVNARPLTEAL